MVRETDARATSERKTLQRNVEAKRAAHLTAGALLVVGTGIILVPSVFTDFIFPEPHFSRLSVRLIGLVAQGYGVYYWSASISPIMFYWSTIGFRIYLGCVLMVIVALMERSYGMNVRLGMLAIAGVNVLGAALMAHGLVRDRDHLKKQDDIVTHRQQRHPCFLDRIWELLEQVHQLGLLMADDHDLHQRIVDEMQTAVDRR